jgi:hypothetical protein
VEQGQFSDGFLSKKPIKCGASLKRKNIVDVDTCPICRAGDEIADHLMVLHCVFARQFLILGPKWELFRIEIKHNFVENICIAAAPTKQCISSCCADQAMSLSNKHYNNVLLVLASWILWRHEFGGHR